MAKKDPDAFFTLLDQVGAGTAALPPVVAIGGAERVFVDDALATIRTSVLQGGLADFNHDRVSARDKPGLEIISLTRTLPVMAKTRLVEVRDADAVRDADVDALAQAIDNPSTSTVLCLVFGDIDLRDKLPKLLDKAKESVALLCRFDHPKEREMLRHVERRARRHNLKLLPGAADALAVTVGADLTLVERAFEKLVLVADGRDVDVNMISAHVADTHLEDAFAFVRAVARGDRSSAISGLAALQAAREEPLRLVGLLAWQLRQVLRARLLQEAGDDVARSLSLFGDRLAAVTEAARRFDLDQHQRRVVRLAQADVALKSSRQPPWMLMMRLVQDLCPPERQPRAAGGARGAKPAAPARR